MKLLQDHIQKHLSGIIHQSGQGSSFAKEIQRASMNETNFFSMCVPKKYQDAEIDLLDKQEEDLRQLGREWARNPTSIFIYGDKGTGKTRFCFALLREMFRSCPRLIWPRYYTSPDLDSKLHKAIMEGGDSHMVDMLSEEDLLFIDDFGRETKTERVKRQYFEILNNRYANERPTILTSNYNIDEIGGMLSDVIASRLEEYLSVRFTGKDLRKRQDEVIV